MENKDRKRTKPKVRQKRTTSPKKIENKTKNRENKSSQKKPTITKEEPKNISVERPYGCLRLIVGTLSLLLFLFNLHCLIYIMFIVTKSPDCFECMNRTNSTNGVLDNDCKTFCDLQHINDFVFVDDPKERNNILKYFCVLLLIRCIAFITEFLGIFLFVVYFMTAYLALHLGLIITFVFTLIFFAVQGLN